MPQSKTCLITGANAGIGKQAATQLATEGHRVLMACRSRERGEPALRQVRAESRSELVELVQVDLSSSTSIRQMASEVMERHDTLDVLIHNAAAFDIAQKQRVLNDDGIELTWATNHLGPVLMTDRLLPALHNAEQGRVLLVSSKGLVVFPNLRVDLDDPEFERRKFTVQKAYYQSKLAQVCYLLDLAEALADSTVTVHGIRVTNVKIDVSRYPGVPRYLLWLYSLKSAFSISPAEMAKTYAWLATAEAASSSTGGYWDGIDKPAKPSKAALDAEHRAAVMKLTRSYLDSS